jgi:hypothetical protein
MRSKKRGQFNLPIARRLCQTPLPLGKFSEAEINSNFISHALLKIEL